MVAMANTAAVFSPSHHNEVLDAPMYHVEKLEREISEFTRVPFVVACANGTSAIYMALKACGITSSCRVAIPEWTFPAAEECVRLLGARPIFLPPELHTWQINYGEYLDGFLSEQVDAFMPVHNYGCSCDISGLRKKANKLGWNPFIVVDAAAALLTPGAFDYDADAYCVSFNWNKSISGGGGGAVLTHSEWIADTCRKLRRHGCPGAFNFQIPAQCANETSKELDFAMQRRMTLYDVAHKYDVELAKYGLERFPKGACPWLCGTTLRDGAAVDRAITAVQGLNYVARRTWTPALRHGQVSAILHQCGIVLPGGYGPIINDIPRVVKAVAEANGD